MKKSIETIWKEGFLKSDALVAPKLNNLYSKKSIHIIDKYKRMFKINVKAIFAGSILFLVGSYFIEIPITGIGFFLVLNLVAIVNKTLANKLDEIDKTESSYQYLKAFDNWSKNQLLVNRKMARFYYPVFFLSIVLGFWFSKSGGKLLSETIVSQVILDFPDIYLVFGVPLIGLIGVISVICILAFFGGRISNWDENLIYGRVFRKLEELITDMEELKNNNGNNIR